MAYLFWGIMSALICALLAAVFYRRDFARFGSIVAPVSFLMVLWYVALATPYFLLASIKVKYLMGLSLAGIIVYVGAYVAHTWRARSYFFFMSVALAATVIVASGIGMREITNPWGDTFSLVQWEQVLFWWQGIAYRITLPADIFTLVWLFIITYTMRRLNTLDGLVSGMTFLGALMIVFLSTATKYFQPEVGMLSSIVAGAFFGMLIWNWHPAKIRLGAGGAAFAGLTLGTLAIISGGKIATTLLVLGIPILDVIWGFVRRVIWYTHHERKQLPLRLLDAGFSHRGAVVFLLVISAGFGITTLFLQSAQKIIALIVLGLVTLFLLIVGSIAEPVSDTPRGIRQRRIILGIAVDSLWREEAVHHAQFLIQRGGQHIITTPNPEMLLQAQHDAEFKNALNRAALALPDGFGLMLAARILKQPLAARIAGVDFVWDLAQLAAERGYAMYLLGGEKGVARQAAQRLKIKVKGLRIVGAEAGPSQLELSFGTKLSSVQSIRVVAPDILLVALGHGKQEKWIAEHLHELPSVKIAMGVGGALNFIAGQVARAPRVLRLLGLEWLWRLVRQPWRLPRIWRAVAVFSLLVLREKLQRTKIL